MPPLTRCRTSGIGTADPPGRKHERKNASRPQLGTNTVYVANFNDGTVSIIDGARCNAKIIAGCHTTAAALTTGAGAGFVAIDHTLHTAFVLNASDNTLSAIDTRRCKGARQPDAPRSRPPNKPLPTNQPGTPSSRPTSR